VRHRLDPFGERTRVSVEADLALTGQGARVERGRLQDDAARIIDSTLHDLVAASSARAVRFEQRREYRPALVVGVAALVALVVLRRVRSRL
jgi:hypothetical protein